MAGTLIVSNLTTDTDNTFIVRSNTGTTLFSANTTGIDVANSIGATAITNDKILSIANTKITGNIVSSQITSVANTQLTGTLIASQIASVNATTATSGTLPTARLPAGSVLQVVSNTKIDTFSTTSSSYVDVTGLFVTITPTSATSKILITGLVNFGASADVGFFRLVRNSTAICVGTAAGSRVAATAQQRNYTDSADADAAALNFLDSPNTTSSVTYKIQGASSSGGYTTRFNSSADDNDTANRGRTASTITVMEIAA
jgi:hypothetical protein